MVGRLLGPPSYCSEKLVQSAFFLQVHNGSIRQGGAFNIESISKPKSFSILYRIELFWVILMKEDRWCQERYTTITTWGFEVSISWASLWILSTAKWKKELNKTKVLLLSLQPKWVSYPHIFLFQVFFKLGPISNKKHQAWC